MLEQTRLAYLEAMGVTNWVPRSALPNAAPRMPADIPAPALEPAIEPEAPPEQPGSTGIANTADGPSAGKPDISALRPGVSARAPLAEATEATPEPVVQPAPAAPARPFYMQLWLAGTCALLIETEEPGLESAAPGFRLLGEILRAAELPVPPKLYADFRWPLTRNRQLDHSAVAASQGLQAFMQARLETLQVSSIGCFGAHTVLLNGPEETIEALAGRIEAIEQLPPAWFVPSLETLMAEPGEKRRLWHALKRIKSHWTIVND